MIFCFRKKFIITRFLSFFQRTGHAKAKKANAAYRRSGSGPRLQAKGT